MSQPEPNPFEGMQPPLLPEGLKQRVLTRARLAARAPSSLTDRLWENRRLRFAWAAMVTLLLGAHLLLAGSPPNFVPHAKESVPTERPTVTEPGLATYLARHRMRSSPNKQRLNDLQPLLLEAIEESTADPFA